MEFFYICDQCPKALTYIFLLDDPQQVRGMLARGRPLIVRRQAVRLTSQGILHKYTLLWGREIKSSNMGRSACVVF